MTLAPLLQGGPGRPTISFELFPPRARDGEDTVRRTVSALADVSPDFFSVTYGASGSTRSASLGLLAHVLADTPVAAMAHLTCVGASRREVVEVASDFLEAGVRNFLALRGDPPAGAADWRAHPEGVDRACDLVELLQVVERRRLALRGGSRPVDEGPLSLAVAAFPSGDHGSDLVALRAKQDAGAQFAIAQVCYDAAEFAAFVADARAAGITLPILPGVMPTTEPARLLRLEQLTGVRVPRDVLARLEAAQEFGDAARHREGVRLTTAFARRLLDDGAPGLHVYTFNSAHAALDLLAGLDLGARTPAPPTPAPRAAAPDGAHPHHHAALAAGRGTR
ncbi:methylenetetrahydrofolate reductase [Kineococcus rubinsiae]|uniref:methylenetetrahydrofolate reductase n=1 Tax=Kineococcus rubinsiae TaxID=2609562 RepID=UPI001AD92E72|nr:methylenetetrahydrofolate reductase [Kineococcus rubinsiae]